MRPALCVGAGDDDADALAFQNGKSGPAQVKNDVTDVGAGVCGRQPEISGHCRFRRIAAAEQIHAWRARRGRRPHTAVRALVGLCEEIGDFGIDGFDAALDIAVAGLFERLRQFGPGQLIVQRERRRHRDEVIDRAGRTGRDAGHAEITRRGIDHVVVVIVGDGAGRTSGLAGIAADTDRGIDQMLAHRCSHQAAFPALAWSIALSFSTS